MSLKKFKQPVILNSAGKPIVLNAKERFHNEWMQKQVNERFGNSLGYEIPITTLTTIMKKISEQKFFEIAPAEYLPVKVGDGAWSAQLTTYRSFDLGDAFETGIINTGGQNSRQATADAGVDAVNVRVNNWAKTIGWSVFDLELAAKSGNWDLVSAKEKARKRNWDLGIQKVAFLGIPSASGAVAGLLSLSGVTVNTSVIVKPLKSMTPAELNVFQQSIIEAYRANSNRTAWPTHFIIPESDYNGLASQSSEDFPIKSKLALLEEAFQLITRNKSFKILPLAYGDVAYSGYSYQQYVLLNYDEESLNMNIPVDYTSTLANSLDNFNFQNSGYGQFTGVQALRPLEVMYFQYTPA